MKVIILAGGEGRRLREIEKEKPKPMVEVATRPFLEHILAQLKKYGLKDIIFSVGYKKNCIKDYFGNGEKLGLSISYCEEEELMGTGGAVKLAAKTFDLGENFLVMNGDSFIDLNYNNFIDAHLSSKRLATIVLVPQENPNRSGVVELSKDLKINDFMEKAVLSGSKLINAGVYAFNARIIDRMPGADKFSLERDVLSEVVKSGEVYGFVHDNYFIDIGIPADLTKARKDFSNPQLF